MTNTIFDALFTTDERGVYTDLTVDTLADWSGVSANEADAFIEVLIDLGMLGEDADGVYDPEERAEWEAEAEEDRLDWEQYTTDAREAAWYATGLAA